MHSHSDSPTPHVLDLNLRRFEQRPLSQKAGSLQLVRILISRGNLAVLEDTIARLRAQDPTLDATAEWRLEMARVAMLNRQWVKGLTEIETVLRLQPTAMTRMNALRNSSIAYYELGDFSAARRESDYIRSLLHIFPRAQIHLHNEILRVKILACEGQIEKSQLRLQQMWTKLTTNRQLTPRFATQLLRTESHVRRCAGKISSRAAYATLILSDSIDEAPCAAVARLELFLAGDSSIRLKEAVARDRRHFAKIDLLLQEIESGNVSSTTAKNLIGTIAENASLFDSNPVVFDMIALSGRKVLLRLKPFESQCIKTDEPGFRVGAGRFPEGSIEAYKHVHYEDARDCLHIFHV